MCVSLQALTQPLHLLLLGGDGTPYFRGTQAGCTLPLSEGDRGGSHDPRTVSENDPTSRSQGNTAGNFENALAGPSCSKRHLPGDPSLIIPPEKMVNRYCVLAFCG